MATRSSSAGIVDLILVGYSPEQIPAAMEACEQAFGKLALRQKILVLNLPASSSASDAAFARDGWRAMPGSNALGEFSGWQEGLAALGPIDDAGRVVFANDTLGGYRRRSRAEAWALRAAIVRVGGEGLVGFTGDSDGSPPGLSILGQALDGWMSTFCFALSGRSLTRLGGRLYATGSLDACVRGGTDASCFFTDEVSEALRRHLVWWLFEGGWRRSEALTAESEPRLVFKARCICAELLLSARCRAAGIEIVDPLRRNWVMRLVDAADAARLSLLGR